MLQKVYLFQNKFYRLYITYHSYTGTNRNDSNDYFISDDSSDESSCVGSASDEDSISDDDSVSDDSAGPVIKHHSEAQEKKQKHY